MRKSFMMIGAIVVAACTVGMCCWAGQQVKDRDIATVTAASGMAASGAATISSIRSLVVYFSMPETDGVDASSGASRVISNGRLMGNTQYVATLISEATGGTLFEIKTSRTYPGSHKALIDAAKAEADKKERPRLTTHIKNLKNYDVIFVGFPNWWYDMPMPLYSFFEEYDFSGKTIIPFCTHGGSRFSGAIRTIRTMEKGARVLDGYAVARNNVAISKAGVNKWLKQIGMIK